MTARLRHGFKAEANDIAREVRAELRLGPVAPLDPRVLAGHLEIPIWGLGSLTTICKGAVEHFSGIGSSAFSAVTVFRGNERVIVHNDTHSAGRQSSNLCHELSHALLLHPPAPALNLLGGRDWDPELELEADWLAGALLLPEEVTLHVARRGLDDEAAADLFGVSLPMLRFRMNVTAARRRVERSRLARTTRIRAI